MGATPDPPDEELARAARGGRREAFADLVHRYERRLFRFLRMRAGGHDDAEELLQETFLRAWTRLSHYDDRRPFSTWVFTIAARLAASSRRRRSRASRASEGTEQLAGGVDPVETAEAGEARRNLWDLAKRVLTAESSSALWLFYAEDLSAREVAHVLGKREPTVRVMIHRARESLARHLQPMTVSADAVSTDALTPDPLTPDALTPDAGSTDDR